MSREPDDSDGLLVVALIVAGAALLIFLVAIL